MRYSNDLSMLQSESEIALRIIPRNYPNGPTVNLPETPVNLFSPCFLRIVVDLNVNAFKQ